MRRFEAKDQAAQESNGAANIYRHAGKVKPADRARVLGQKGLVVWFTGLSGSGKSTIGVEVEKELNRRGRAVYLLDGDNIRLGLNADLGFSDEDRNENIRRIAEVAALFRDAGLIVLVCFISPFRKMREFARAKAGEGSFLEIFVQADLETCAARDPKALYRRAAAGEISGFTGISAPYEEPLHPDLVLKTETLSVEESVREVTALILARCRP